jgi:hypothetical protein
MRQAGKLEHGLRRERIENEDTRREKRGTRQELSNRAWRIVHASAGAPGWTNPVAGKERPDFDLGRAGNA